MIRDVTELREHGQVCRRVADLDVDLDTWRAGMRRAARQEGMRIRTFVGEPPTPDDGDFDADQGDDVAPDQPAPLTSGPVVYAVRTDLPPDLDKMATVVNQIAENTLGPTIEAMLHPAAPVTSLACERARRTSHHILLPPLSNEEAEADDSNENGNYKKAKSTQAKAVSGERDRHRND